MRWEAISSPDSSPKEAALIHPRLTDYQTASVSHGLFGRKMLLQEIICFLFAVWPAVGPSQARQRQSLRASFFLPLRSNISAGQSIVPDRQLLELELGRVVTANTACLFSFLLCKVGYYKSLWMRASRHWTERVWRVRVCANRRAYRTGRYLNMCPIYIRSHWCMFVFECAT